MLIPLVCTQCGGKLEAEAPQIFESGDTYIVSSDQTLKCPHCETKYMSGEKIKRFVEKFTISINGGIASGNFVIGNGNVFNNITISKTPTADTDNKEEKNKQ